MSVSIASSLASVLWTALLAPPAPATPPATSAPTTRMAAEDAVGAILARLADAESSVRDEAQRQLLALPDAPLLPRLQAARKQSGDPDVQLRLDTLLVQVQERVDIGGSRVTLKFTDAPLNLVLDALEAQAHANFGGAGGEAGILNNNGQVPLVTLDLQDVSFWRAVEEIQDRADVIFFAQPDGWRVARANGQPSMVRGSEAGAFLVQPQQVNYSRNVTYARNMGGGAENFSLQFQMLAEPKVHLAAGIGKLDVDRAVDSNGNDLLGGGGGRMQQIYTGPGQGAIVCQLQLKYPKNPGAQISEVSGTIRVSMARHVETLASEDAMAKGKVQATIDGATVSIEPFPAKANDSARRAGGDPAPVDLLITVVSPRGEADPNFVGRVQQGIQSQLHVTDARGTPLRLTSNAVTRSDVTHTEMRATFVANQPQLSKGPFKMRLDVPTSYRDVDVPFAMRDLKMP